MNVYEIVTQKVIEQLEQGVAPWSKPWTSDMPCNLISQRAYRGINVFLLGMQGYESKYWLSFNQCNKLGGKIKKGSNASMVCFYKVGEETENEKTGKRSRPFLLRYSSVFNLCQTENISLPRAVFEHSKRSEFEAISACETLAEGFPNPPAFELSDRAWYAPKRDVLGMPGREKFSSPAGYYATLFHELTHATGHESRLGREGFDTVQNFGSESYSREELTAELGSAYLCGLSGISQETLPQSASYLASWIARLRGDSKLIINAASAAQKAVDYIAGSNVAESVSETE